MGLRGRVTVGVKVKSGEDKIHRHPGSQVLSLLDPRFGRTQRLAVSHSCYHYSLERFPDCLIGRHLKGWQSCLRYSPQ